MQVTVHTAKSQLSRLIDAARAGQDVVIAKGNVPVARLVPVQAGRFKYGLLQVQLSASTPDFLEPLPDDELDAWEGRE